MSGLWVDMMKSGFEFLYTSLDDVCSHCHLRSLVNSRYAIIPLAPVFRTAVKERMRGVTRPSSATCLRMAHLGLGLLTFLVCAGHVGEVVVVHQVVAAHISDLALLVV